MLGITGRGHLKSITIDVPREGTRIDLFPRAGSSYGQVVVVLADDVEMQLMQPSQPAAVRPAAALPSAPEKQGQVAPESKKSDLAYILKRLLKLRPASRAAAENSIKAMFQFGAPVSDQEASAILKNLCTEGSINVDARGKVQYRDVPQGAPADRPPRRFAA